jgi:hypothetical protein
MSIEAMKMALEALEDVQEAYGNHSKWFKDRVDALRQAIEQEEKQEPVAWINKSRNLLSWDKFYADMTPLYTAPVDAVNMKQERVDEIVKQEHDRAVELGQAYERGWNAALAQQEPVAWMGAHDKTDLYYRKPPQADVIPLYTAPLKKQWVGLTMNEAKEFYEKYTDRAELINALDKFLEEKNT